MTGPASAHRLGRASASPTFRTRAGAADHRGSGFSSRSEPASSAAGTKLVFDNHQMAARMMHFLGCATTLRMLEKISSTATANWVECLKGRVRRARDRKGKCHGMIPRRTRQPTPNRPALYRQNGVSPAAGLPNPKRT